MSTSACSPPFERCCPTWKRCTRQTRFTVGVNDGAAAGQSTPHVHVHVVPRNAMATDGDDFEKGEADGAHAALELVAAMIELVR